MLKTTGKTILLLSLFLLAACSGQKEIATAIPTPDLNPIRTEVAATVLAQVPQLCALTPSATQELLPTATLAPATATLPPTATNAQISASGTPDTKDLALWVSQTVQDDTVFLPGQVFNMTWQIKNVGTSTWTAGYRLRYYSGNAFGATKEVALGKDVKPGETVEINVAMKAPAQGGDYRSDWVLSNESLRNFKEPVFLKIKVAVPTASPTVTKTPLPPTATNTPKP
jgi:hypothetical protein